MWAPAMNPSTSSGLVAVSQKATRDRRGSSSFARNHAATAAATVPAREKSPTPASRPNPTIEPGHRRRDERVLDVRVPAAVDRVGAADGEPGAVRVELGQRRAVVPLTPGHELGLDAVGALVRGRDGGPGEREQEAERATSTATWARSGKPPGPGDQPGPAVGTEPHRRVVRGRDGAGRLGVGQRHAVPVPLGVRRRARPLLSAPGGGREAPAVLQRPAAVADGHRWRPRSRRRAPPVPERARSSSRRPRRGRGSSVALVPLALGTVVWTSPGINSDPNRWVSVSPVRRGVARHPHPLGAPPSVAAGGRVAAPRGGPLCWAVAVAARPRGPGLSRSTRRRGGFELLARVAAAAATADLVDGPAASGPRLVPCWPGSWWSAASRRCSASRSRSPERVGRPAVRLRRRALPVRLVVGRAGRLRPPVPPVVPAGPGHRRRRPRRARRPAAAAVVPRARPLRHRMAVTFSRAGVLGLAAVLVVAAAGGCGTATGRDGSCSRSPSASPSG